MKKKLRTPFVYLTIEDKQAAITRNNAKTMRNSWHCDRTYTVGGKTMHLKKKKHSRNYNEDKDLIEL